MDIITSLTGISSAFGLSTSAGLNAYIPLLIVALTSRFTDWIDLSAPYNVLESWPVIAILSVLLLIETFVDKIPAVDTINDVVQTVVRPTAGAVLFAANAHVITDINPTIALVLGLLMAGGVHATKSTVRPVITAATVGTGNSLVSLLEDIISTITSILAIFFPVMMIVFVMIIVIIVYRRFRKRSSVRFQPIE